MARPKQDLVRVNLNVTPDLRERAQAFADENQASFTSVVTSGVETMLALAAAWDNGCDVIIRAMDGTEAIVPLPLYGLAKTVARFGSNHSAPAHEA